MVWIVKNEVMEGKIDKNRIKQTDNGQNKAVQKQVGKRSLQAF